MPTTVRWVHHVVMYQLKQFAAADYFQGLNKFYCTFSQETVCTDVWGFCKPHVQDSCREILNKILADVVGLKKSVTVYSMAKR